MARLIFIWLLVFGVMSGSDTILGDALVVKAQNGNAAAQFELSLMYFKGLGVQKDSVVGMRWLRMAAEQGYARAQCGLGALYFTGEGVPKDNNEAVKWIRKAVEQGFSDAQFLLGVSYANGDGVPKNSDEAVKWYLKAAKQGNADAQAQLGWMYFTGDGVSKNSAEAMKWYSKAAEQGNALGAKWLRMAADQGDAVAQAQLAWMYVTGTSVPKDSANAVKWARIAANQGNASAQYILGVCYANGEGVQKNSAEAIRWYRKAAEQGNADAQCNLGFMYSSGTGVPKDEIEGLAWSNIAAASGNEVSIKNRETYEQGLGPEVTLAAQQRSKQIMDEIEASRNASPSQRSGGSPSGNELPSDSPKASGSGAVVSTDGLVLTAAHVVSGASKMKIFTTQGMKTAKVLCIDEANDLAVLKLGEGVYSALSVVPSRKIQLGQTVATIGFPNVELQGFSPKVTRGEISSLNGFGDDPRAWQISVPVQSGNSGGPLLDEYGNLVGVVVSKLGIKAATITGDLPQNVNYAVKGSYAIAILEPYWGKNPPVPVLGPTKPGFEDMVAKAQKAIVLILVY